MDDALKALFHVLDDSAPQKRTLFIGGHVHPDLKTFSNCQIQQHFKPYAELFEAAGIIAEPFLEACSGEYGQILLLAPKTLTEAAYQVACAVERLEQGGALIVAAANKAGGSRLEKMVSGLGLDAVSGYSKSKCRVVTAIKGKGVDQAALDKALQAGRAHVHPQTGFKTQAGLFSWDRVDKGSAMLVEYLPETLSGHGADFGCGYGYLSRWVAENCKDVQALVCVDADARAASIASDNLEDVHMNVQPLWADLTKENNQLKNLDFIVMNPPFHKGKHSDPSIGKAFIKTAATALKPGGTLWCVANAHLPYEAVFNDMFSQSRMVTQSNGFKVLQAVK